MIIYIEHAAEFLWQPIGGFFGAPKGAEFLLPPYFDFAATFLWAISGGLLRDGLFLQDGVRPCYCVRRST